MLYDPQGSLFLTHALRSRSPSPFVLQTSDTPAARPPISGVIRTGSGSLIDIISKQPTPAPSTLDDECMDENLEQPQSFGDRPIDVGGDIFSAPRSLAPPFTNPFTETLAVPSVHTNAAGLFDGVCRSNLYHVCITEQLSCLACLLKRS